MLDPFAQPFQHCWGHAHSLRIVYKDLWVVSFPRCTAGRNIVGSCCARFSTQPKGFVTAVLLVHVVYNASYASFFAMELEKSLVNDDIRATCKTNLSPKHYIKRYKQQELTLKNCYANKVSKITISICCNLIQHFHPCLPLNLLGYSYLLFMF